MTSLDALRRIELFNSLDDNMLEKLQPLIKHRECEAKEILFETGETAINLFVLLKGKVLLTMAASETVHVSVMSVDTGGVFGWTALLGGGYYTATAVCEEPCSVLIFNGRDFRVLMHNDHSMGFRIMEYTAREMNRRLEKRTNQLFQTLLEHIDMACGLVTTG